MRAFFMTALCFAGSPALAHVGHLGEAAGHDHWIALGALGLAGAIALWQGLKGRRDAEAEDDEAESEEQDEEATA